MKLFRILGWSLLVLFTIFSILGGIFLFTKGFYELSVTLFALIFLIDFFIINRNAYPYRYMIPALILLFILVLYPIAFTIRTAFTNYGTGHISTRQEVIERLLVDPIYTYVVEDGKQFSYSIYVRYEGTRPTQEFKIILNDGNDTFIARDYKVLKSEAGSIILAEADLIKLNESGLRVERQEGRIEFIFDAGKIFKYFYSPDDPETTINEDFFRYQILFPVLSKIEFVDSAQNRFAIRQFEDGTFRLVQINHLYKLGLAEVIEKGKSIVKVVLINTKTGKPLIEENGTIYDINEKGERFAVAGYISGYGLKNFTRIFTDPTISGPFARIFVWNFTWAALSVLFTFVIGLSLALVLNNPNLRGRTIYRSLLIIPWAIPAFISVLVWKNGFFNETYGILNKFIITGLFGREPIRWFNDPFWAKVAVLTVNTWLGFPYMMVVSLGALQSIPEDYYEAAAIDGATKWQRFWKITFPLLMTTVAPLLVGSFAFNFNNFVNIYLLTGGGPAMPNTTTPAGATDILISYTYKLAFEGGRGQDFGFASAISILIFLIVGSLSFINFKLSGSFEEVNR
ncbi:ABC transporter permease subunit [Fervidobacterium thailandense]|uniref:Maltose/maltodextrin transport system permease protein n=1 Tax=Fervidobacterium thailandense TaxID=1008305 RepID=A0A1E3G236_9BACT|nr:ABC transporter permease subunit [Fervidobacterium thailandense]ODN30291.1 maltose ABC transporter permease [Fervidobacterium thailandense]